MRKFFRKLHTNQTGAAMALVLIFMTVAALVVPPMLSYMSTGFKTGMIHEENTRELYAAESGVNDGLWYARYDDFSTLFPSYKEYDFQTAWDYNLAESINGLTVHVEVENVWLPSNISAPIETEARTIIENGQLILSGSAPPESSTYRVRLSFYPDVDNDPKIESFGIWLPPGFTYVEGSSNLEDDPVAAYYPENVTVTPHASGQAVVWNFWSVPIADFGPEVGTEGASIVSTITFDYISTEGDERPGAVSWVTTSDAPDVPFTWDADTRIYHITADAGDSSVETYVGRSEIRELDSAVNGDYLAIGNTLMTATGDPAYRNRLYSDSSAVVAAGDLPDTTTIRSARLYWSGWIDEPHETEIFYDNLSSDGQWEQIWQDDCTTLENVENIWHDDASSLGNEQVIWSESCNDYYDWQNGAEWGLYNGSFYARNSSADPGDSPEGYPQSTLVLETGILDLSSYNDGDLTISWLQSEWGYVEDDDRLYYQFYGNGGWGPLTEAFRGSIGSTPQEKSVTIPGSYCTADFRLRFFITEFRGGDEYCFIDDIQVTSHLAGGWTAGADWEVDNDRFRGHHIGVEQDRYLTLNENINLSAYSGQEVILSFEQSEWGNLWSSDGLLFRISGDGGQTWSSSITAFYDDYPQSPKTYVIPEEYLTDQFRIQFYLDRFEGNKYAYIDEIDISVRQTGGWTAGADWDVYNDMFRGHRNGMAEEDHYLTLNENIDLSAYADRDVRITWEQDEAGNLRSWDALRYRISGDGGETWSSLETAFYDDNPQSPEIFEIPDQYKTDEFRIRFILEGFSDNGDYAFMDNIAVEGAQEGDWIRGGDWEIYNDEFRGHHEYGNGESDRYLTLGTSIDLSAYQGTEVEISWNQHEYGYLESDDGLKFSLSANNGVTWSSLETAFMDDYPSSSFSYTIPGGYLTSGFRIRFYLEGASGDGEYIYVDDILISQEDFGVGTVVFNGHEITADRQQFEENDSGWSGSGTYSYSCFYDATDLVNQMIDDEELNDNGSGTYTLGHVLRLRDGDPYSVPLYPSGQTGYPLGIPNTDTGYGEYAYAGWSLILIYSSPEADGHQMYLYDDFSFVGSGDTVNLPISGFLTPPSPDGSRMTCFVGEGDPFYTGDYVRLNGELLSDDVNPANNFFNSYSNALDDPNLNGIDLDTFDISAYVQPGDTSADFETGTPQDIYNIVYIILSFRHDTTFSGTVSYLIRN